MGPVKQALGRGAGTRRARGAPRSAGGTLRQAIAKRRLEEMREARQLRDNLYDVLSDDD
ncbi:MAG TPA: hypothetical protein VKA76_13965 [Gammaproteobacteria bacterium]|nr:hypothetical protein [Gammaproteobacteria bacterium]